MTEYIYQTTVILKAFRHPLMTVITPHCIHNISDSDDPTNVAIVMRVCLKVIHKCKKWVVLQTHLIDIFNCSTGLQLIVCPLSKPRVALTLDLIPCRE